MTDKAIAKLIDTINSSAQNMPSMVDKMVHQYAIGCFTQAGLLSILSAVLSFIAYLFYKQGLQRLNEYDEGFGFFIVAGILGVTVLILVIVVVFDISYGFSPIYSIIRSMS